MKRRHMTTHEDVAHEGVTYDNCPQLSDSTVNDEMSSDCPNRAGYRAIGWVEGCTTVTVC